MTVILDYNPTTGVTEYFDAVDDETYKITKVQDLQDHVDWCRENASMGLDKRREWWPAASIPNIVIEKLQREKGINVFDRNHWPAVKRMLNSNEFRDFRLKEFTI